MIVDSSIVLAILFGEEKADLASELLNESMGALHMSVVNVAESQMRIRSQVRPSKLNATLKAFAEMPILRISSDLAQAELAAIARLRYPALNFGECFAYSLAKLRNEPLLTFDEDFLTTDLTVVGI